MKNPNTTVLHKYRNGEFIQFMKNVDSIYESFDTKALQLEKRVVDLRLAVKEMDDLFLTSKTHKITSELQSLDAVRNNVLKAIRSFLDNVIAIGDKEMSEAAELLLDNYFVHGKRIERLNSQQKTATINALINDWTTDPILSNSVSLLKLNDWVALLTTKNKDFDSNYVQRASTRIRSVELSDKKRRARIAFDELRKDTESFFRVSADNTAYRDILDKISSLLADYRTSVVSRMADRKRPVEEVQETQSLVSA
jgi:hypothetical protein